MSRVWNDPTITDQFDLIALLAIADYANDEGVAWPSTTSIAKKCRCSTRALYRILDRLKKAGKLVIRSGGGRFTSQYTIQNITPDLKSPLTHSQGSPASICQGTPDRGDRAPLTELCHTIHQGTVIEPSRKGKKADLPPLDLVFGAWNSKADNKTIPKCLVLSDKRRHTLSVRLREPFFTANWPEALERLCSSDFCKGLNDRGWKADFDWFIKPDSVARIMEGKYSNPEMRTVNGKPAQKSIMEKDLDRMLE